VGLSSLRLTLYHRHVCMVDALVMLALVMLEMKLYRRS
jgi:hypothetical protein